MPRPKPVTLYALAVGVSGVALLLITTAIQAPQDLGSARAGQLVSRAVILLALTFLSSIAPLRTRHGAVLTVGLAPLFGALLALPPWALMWVAALGTLD